jgi:hypothetical protein
VSVDSLSYDPLLITCFDGLIEEGHPYNFLAFNAIKEMLEDEVLLLLLLLFIKYIFIYL